VAHTCFAVEIEDKIAHVRLNRPEALNTMIPAFWDELPRIVTEIDEQASARVIVLSSTGRHFTAGLDLSVLQGAGSGEKVETGRARANLRRAILRLQDSLTAIEKARIPVIAAIQGGCIGGGVDMTSACDMRYCTEDAFFVIQETNIGIVADVGTLQRLPHLVPQGVVRELAYTGRRLPAREAQALGLVNAVYPDQQAMLDAVMGVAREIASKSPLAIWGTKEMLNYARDHSVADGLNYIATWQTGMFQTADTMEAMRARQEKRDPAYDDLAPAGGGGFL
jgi:enoyl-CoA hydratase